MQNSIVKNVLACLVLSILCFGLGSSVADSYITSAGILIVLIGAVSMLLVGTRSWMLLFLLPPLMEFLPLTGQMAHVPKGFFVAPMVMGYWLLLWILGYAKLQWRSLVLLDILVLVLLVLMVSTFIRRPVAIAVLGIENDIVGGASYANFVMALIYYIALSCIPIKVQQLSRVLNISVVLKLGVTFILMLMVLAGVRGVEIDIAEAMSASGGRLTGFHVFGSPICMAIFSYFSFASILINPFKIVSFCVAFVVVLLAGSRHHAGMLVLNLIALMMLKREVVLAVLIGFAAYAMVLVFSWGGGLEDMPISVQRIAAMAPGVKVEASAVDDGNATWQWRERLWDMALDERTGYIENYVFGDGYGQSISETQRRYRALIRGEYAFGQDLDEFAVNGVWHNGIILSIHRVGYVGLAALVLWIVVAIFYTCRVISVWRGKPLFKPLLFWTSGIIVFPATFAYGDTGPTHVFYHFVPAALVKLAYCMARDEGMIQPIWGKKRYVPQMIREHGEELVSPAN